VKVLVSRYKAMNRKPRGLRHEVNIKEERLSSKRAIDFRRSNVLFFHSLRALAIAAKRPIKKDEQCRSPIRPRKLQYPSQLVGEDSLIDP
jgi:hypothetical protein